MLVDELISESRVLLNDTDELEFSETELLKYLNNGIDIIENILSSKNSSILLNELDIVSSSTQLPSDLLKISNVYNSSTKKYFTLSSNVDISENEYKIIGNTLKVLYPPVKLIYFKRLKRYNKGQKLEIDEFFNSMLVDYVVSSAKSRLLDMSDLENNVINTMNVRINEYVYSRDGVMPLKRYNNYWV